MTTDLLVDPGLKSRLFHGLLHQVLVNVVPSHLAAAGVHREALGREHILPDPFGGTLWIFPGQGRPEIDTGYPFGTILLIDHLHTRNMLLQRSRKSLRQHRYPVLLHREASEPVQPSYLPVLDARPFARIGQKGFNILTRTMAQPLPGQKINKGLHPLDIKERTIGTHPVILYTGLKSIPKFLNCGRLLWTFFIHKNEPIQWVNLQHAAL